MVELLSREEVYRYWHLLLKPCPGSVALRFRLVEILERGSCELGEEDPRTLKHPSLRLDIPVMVVACHLVAMEALKDRIGRRDRLGALAYRASCVGHLYRRLLCHSRYTENTGVVLHFVSNCRICCTSRGCFE